MFIQGIVRAAFGKMVFADCRRNRPFHSLERQSANVQFSFGVWSRHSLRESANEGLFVSFLQGARCEGYLSSVSVANPRTPYHAAIWRQWSALQRGKLVSVPYLTRDANAAYSSLRRKKRHSLSGDSAATPSEESEQLCRAVPNFLVGLEPSQALESKHDFVICLTPTSKAGKTLWVREFRRVE